MKTHKAGYITILGKPNAGKSTLLNTLLQTPLSIATPKAQTTRHRILGIYNDDHHQIVFSDTPGILEKPAYELHKAMLKQIWSSLEDADGIVLLLDPNDIPSTEWTQTVHQKVPTITCAVINKIDICNQTGLNMARAYIHEYWPNTPIFEVSATLGTNTNKLLEFLCSILPAHPPFYDKEDLSDRHIRFFVAEMIREQIFLLYEQEIPYSCEVRIIDYKEKTDMDVIQAEIYVERDSQKGILIGKNGTMLRKLGMQARLVMEKFLNKKVFLDIRIKVLKDWRKKSELLKKLGYY